MEPMKRVALFSTHCNTEEKVDALVKNMQKAKSLGMDIVVLSTLPLPAEAHQLADFIIYSKENPIPRMDEKTVYRWDVLPSGTRLLSFIPDYGYPSLLQLKRLLDFGLMIGYDHLFTMIYDIDITPEIENVLLEGRTCSFFRNPRVSDANVAGGILTAFDRENAKKFSMLFTKASYINSGMLAEEWMNSVRKLIAGKVEDFPANDTIHSGSEELDPNHLSHPNFTVFIAKSEKGVDILFYNVNRNIEASVETNLGTHTVSTSSQEIVNIADDHEKVTSLKIVFEGNEVDLTQKFQRIYKTVIES